VSRRCKLRKAGNMATAWCNAMWHTQSTDLQLCCSMTPCCIASELGRIASQCYCVSMSLSLTPVFCCPVCLCVVCLQHCTPRSVHSAVPGCPPQAAEEGRPVSAKFSLNCWELCSELWITAAAGLNNISQRVSCAVQCCVCDVLMCSVLSRG
jgi:hypothetical protein